MKLNNRPLLLLTGCCRNSRKIFFVCGRAILLAGIMVLIAWRFSQAASLTWDGGDATHNGTFGGTGTWDLNTTANWDNGAADVFWTDNSATGVDTAIFSGTAGTVTLNTNVSALGLQFTTTGYTISGTGVLTLGSGGINAGTLTTGTTTIGNALSLFGAQSWTLGAGGTLAASGTITRNVGSTVNFSSTGTFTGAGLVGATSATIANGWATVGGTNWAINDGTNITALTNYVSATATTSTAGGTTAANYTGKDVDVTSSPGVLGGVVTINSLRFNTAAADTFTLATGVNTITSGGILVTSAVGNNLSTIAGGTLQGASGKDLVVIQNNTTNGLTIASVIQNNTTATGLTKSGAGTLTLTGTNTYTGGTTINAGTVALTTNNAGFGTGSVAIGASGTVNITFAGDATIANVFTGTGTITVAGSTGTPTFSNASGLNGFTGTLNVNTTGAKKVVVSAAGEKIGSGATVNITSGSTLYLTTTTASFDGVTFNVVGSGNTENLGAIRIETNSVIGATSSIVLGGDTTLGSNAGIGTINAAISQSTTSAVTKVGVGTLVLGGANTYTGATTIGTGGSATSGGTLTISGASGSINLSSGISIIGSGSKLLLDNTAGNVDRVKDTGNVSSSLGGELSLTGNGTTDSTETMGAIGVGAGSSIVTVTSAANRVTTLAASGLSRTSNGTGLVRGTSLNQSATTNVSRITLGTAPTGADFVGTNTLSGGATNDATQALKIVPWLIGDTAVAGTGSNFVTYDSTLGLRVLLATEQTTLTTGYTTAANDDNVNAGTNITVTNAAGIAVNSLLFNATSALNSTNSNALTVDSGAILDVNVAASIGSGFSKLTLGNGEGVISVTGNTLTINTPVDVTSSGGLTKTGAGSVVLTAANLYTGATTINQGTLTVGNGTTGSLASDSGAVTVSGGATFALNQASTTNFANDVANAGTFNITNNGTQTLSGNITGAGGGNFSTIGSGKTLILSGTANTYSNGTSLTGTLQFNAGSTSGVSGASSVNSAISMNSGATLQLRGDNNATFNTGTITMNSDLSTGADTTSFNFDVGPASTGSNKTLTLGGTVTFTTNTSGNRGGDIMTLNLTGATGYTLAITNAIGASSNGQIGQNYFYNVASGLTLSLGGLNSGIGGTHTFQGAGNTIVGTLIRNANRFLTVVSNQTGTVTFNNAANNGGGTNNYATALNAGTTVFNNVSAVNGVQINLGNQTALSTADANFLLGGSTGLNGGLSFGSTVRPFDTTSGLLTIGGQNTSGTNTFTAGIQLGNTANIGKSVNLVAAGGGQVDFTAAIANNGTDTTAGVSINGAYTVNAATVTPTGTVRLAGANTYRGTTTIAGGTLLADSANALNTTALGGNVTFTGGTLKLGSTFNAGANADISARIKNSTEAISIDTNALTTPTFGSVLDATNSGGLTKLNTGTLSLTAANLYTGTTTVTGGTLKTTGSGTLGSTSNNLVDNATLDVGATSQGVGALSGSGTIDDVTGVGTPTFAVGNGDATGGNFSGVIKNTTGALALVKTGTGTQTLSGANTYTGTTTVNGGELIVSGSLNGTLNVNVASAGTLASGTTGSIATATAGDVAISGTLAPGDLGSVGTLTLAPGAGGKLNFLSGATFNFTISGATSDLVSFSTSGDWLSGSGNVALTLTGITAADYGNTYTVFHNVSTSGFVFSSISGYDTANYLANFTQVGGDYQLSFLAVPEPSMGVSLLGGVGLLLVLRRRGNHSRA